MKTRLPLTPSTTLRTSLSLLAVLLISACASATPVAPTQPVVVEPIATSLPVEPTLEVATQIVPPTEAPAQAPQPLATSRGPDLHATDPTTVSLASGQLQFVEFFRFT